MQRRKAREAALQALFQIDVGKAETEDAVAYVVTLNDLNDAGERFCRELVTGVLANLELIDGLIAEHSFDWDIRRLGNVERNILRMAIFELMHLEDVPVGVTINEAVEIAKTFANDDSGRFVNGILGRFVRERNLNDDEDDSEG
ncbi:MAG: transcription antitermination factor NusB [Firmicutes bacterium]|jgi:N utilization substance protein B|nr:transcription antitermination factor NusB [Bacillota bacterium]